MNQPPFTIEILGTQDRTGFSCGVEPLDRYFHTQVSQDIRRRVTGCNILIERESGFIAGFYTLSACHTKLADLPPEQQKKLPRYPNVPAVRLGRLAVDRRYQGQKLGSVLLMDAVRRSIRSDVVAHMMIVEAKDEAAAAFYMHHGFLRDIADPMRLFKSLDHLARELDV